MAADRAHRGMKEKADVADGEAGDVADFPVAQAALEPEMDDLALVGRQGVHNVEDLRERLLRIVPFVQPARHRDVRIVEMRAPGGLPAGIDGQVPADGEQPRRHVLPDSLRILPAEAEEGFLDDIPRPLQVA